MHARVIGLPALGRKSMKGIIHQAIERGSRNGSTLSDGRFSCPYAELNDRIDRVREKLSARGVRPEDTVVAEIVNSLPGALTLLALLANGNGLMTIPAPGRGARVEGVAVPMPRFARWHLGASGIAPEAGTTLDDVIEGVDVQPSTEFDESTARSDLAGHLFLRTSGSLGTPKLVVHNLETFGVHVEHCARHFAHAPAARVLIPVPLFHMFGLGAAFLPALLRGVSISLLDRANLLRFLEREREFNPDTTFMTPPFCEALVRGRRGPRRYDGQLVVAGDRIGASAFERSEQLHGPLVNAYGSTEMGFVFSADRSMPAEIRRATVGHPLPCVEWRIAEPGDESVEQGPGVLEIRHTLGFKGYVDLEGNRVTPPNAFVDGWFHTGDLARPGPEGTVEVLGRESLSVNRNGMLMTFAELEAVIRELPEIAEVAVTAGAENMRGHAIVAFCKLNGTGAATEASIRASLASRVPGFAVPERVHLLDELPKLPSGKVDRSGLRRQAEALTSPGSS